MSKRGHVKGDLQKIFKDFSDTLLVLKNSLEIQSRSIDSGKHCTKHDMDLYASTVNSLVVILNGITETLNDENV